MKTTEIQPAAWEHIGGDPEWAFTRDRETVDEWEAERPGSVRPLYTAPPDAGIVITLRNTLEEVQSVFLLEGPIEVMVEHALAVANAYIGDRNHA